MTNAQAHVGAAHLVGAADAGAGARRDQLLRRATAAALAGTREPHGLGAPTAAYAVCVGATRAAGGRAAAYIPTAAAWPRRWTSSTSTTRAGRSSRLIGRGGGRCCRAARHRRLSNSRPRPRHPCSYPTPSCAPGVQPAAAARTIRTNAPPTQAPSCIDGRHLAARRGADHAPRGKK